MSGSDAATRAADRWGEGGRALADVRPPTGRPRGDRPAV